jgi:hypothetical protein
MRNALVLALLSFFLACGGDSSAPSGNAAPTCPSAASTTCHGACTDLSRNQDNCGSCGNACGPMERCQGGACTFIGCYQELASCDGICRSLGGADTCGACSSPCLSGQVCSLQQCADACSGGLTDCNRSCVDIASDPDNCGACGATCNLSCVAGHCTSNCPAGWQSCVAGCRDVANDRLHCGICGNACAPGESCAQGSCVPGAR